MDIPKIIKEMRELRESVDCLHTQVCNLTRSNQRLLKENKELRQRLSKYEQPPKDSSNSGTPPSKENIKSEVVRRTSSLREKSDKPVGGQVGHAGVTRQAEDSPEEIIDHFSTYCSTCGADLSPSERVLEYTRQEVDVPWVEPVIREHRYYTRICKCGCRNRGYESRKPGGNKIVFGKNVQALVVYYNVVQCIPYERLQLMLKSIYGIKMSQGTISNIIQSAKQKSEPAIAMIKDFISRSPVVGFDESGCYCNDRLDWSWIAQTIYCTLVFRARGRGSKVLDDMFGESLENMTAVTDRHSAYFTLNFFSHQICLAHILRELKYLGQIDARQQWSVEMESLLKEAIHTRNQNPKIIIDIGHWLERLDKILKQNVEHLGENFRRLKNGLIKCRDYIFKFLENPSIPSNNNASERGFRKLKVKQKVSGTFRSDEGADAFFALHSICDTARKNSQSELQAILAII